MTYKDGFCLEGLANYKRETHYTGVNYKRVRLYLHCVFMFEVKVFHVIILANIVLKSAFFWKYTVQAAILDQVGAYVYV